MTEHQKAKAWRESRNLTPERLAELTGYSTVTLYWMERGCTPPLRNAKSGRPKDRKIRPWVWQRYKMACAAVDHQLRTGKGFDW